MRASRFDELVEGEFGRAMAGHIRAHHVLSGLPGGSELTADEALAAGMSARTVWQALCDSFGIPAERQLGVDPGPPRNDATQ